jgi:hypothetical protein
MIDMYRKSTRRKMIQMAVLTCGTCAALGLGCIQAILASIGATFF